MIITTTPNVENRPVKEYLGLVNGEAILGTSIVKDYLAVLSDLTGARSIEYEASLESARETAISEMLEKAQKLGANAIIGVDIDYESIDGEGTSMLMVTASGTAVIIS